jgi:hypothetical protein
MRHRPQQTTAYRRLALSCATGHAWFSREELSAPAKSSVAPAATATRELPLTQGNTHLFLFQIQLGDQSG